MHRNASLALSLLLGLAGCAAPTTGGSGGDEEVGLPDFESFVDEKSDTGYVGTRAAELEASFTGRVRVLLPDETPERLAQIAEALRNDPRSWEHRHITAQVTEQTKYARNALKAKDLNLNLEGGSPTFSAVEVVEGGLDLSYEVRVESLVKFKDLEERGLTPEDLVGRHIEPRLPLVPEGVFERAGIACATDPDTGGDADAEELTEANFFYYFDPDREGCTLGEQDLVTARYAIESSLDAPTVYPEYDRLVADGRIDMVAIFGQITHGELSSSDWGFIAFRSFSREFERHGFRKVETYPEDRGHVLEKTYPSGLVVRIDMLTPVGFADHVDRAESNERFRSAIRDNEIVYYNGHAFYGSLNVLDDRSAYPADVYQIVFMDACWSYAYYTKQIFRNRATDDDPEGYRLVDVVNNTEPGITGSEATAAILYRTVFDGADAVRGGADATIYSWNNAIKYMNEHAELRARRRVQYPDPEIYGVSGVVTNAWAPGGGGGEEPEPDGEEHASAEAVDIPDDDPAGAESRITVPAGAGEVDVVGLSARIEHTYVGDLTVTLEHDGRTVTLHDRAGGSTDDLRLDVSLEDFAGTAAEGDWTLRVVDGAAVDTGRIVEWSITL